MRSMTYLNITAATAIIVFLSFILVNIAPASANGRLLEPACRSSLWRFPEYQHLNPFVNYNDNHLDCGGMVPEIEDGLCGICGDPISDRVPRPNEDGGFFGKGIIVRTYKSGQEIPITIQLTQGQKGFFEISLCAENDVQDHVDPNCYRKHILRKMDIIDEAAKYYNLTVTLPNVKCNTCVLRWRYRTGNNWGECGGGRPGALGCGPQQSFHGCSDIAIQ